MGEIRLDKSAEQREVLQQAEWWAHNRRRVRARAEGLGGFWIQNAGNYHDLYVKTDVALLTDVFENFQSLCQEQYRLDPAHYTSTGVELELLTDLEMHLFIERGMRGGISMVKQEIRRGKQPDATGLRPEQAKKIHHVPRRKQPLRGGNEQATPEKRFSMETCYAHRGGDPKEKRECKEWMDSWGWSLISSRTA